MHTEFQCHKINSSSLGSLVNMSQHAGITHMSVRNIIIIMTRR